MYRVIFALLLGGIALLIGPAHSEAGSLAGTLQLPTKVTQKAPFKAPGYWRGLQNEVLKRLPPLVDPRQKMVVTLAGAGLSKNVAVKLKVRLTDMRFWPPVLPVHRKQTVAFVNDDKVKHNLTSDGDDTTIPEMPLPPGTKGRHSFTSLGAYRVTCTEVPHMKGTVLVLDEPQFARVDASGIFFFPEIADGEYTLKVWYGGSWIHTEKVIVKGGKNKVKVQLKTTKGKE